MPAGQDRPLLRKQKPFRHFLAFFIPAGKDHVSKGYNKDKTQHNAGRTNRGNLSTVHYGVAFAVYTRKRENNKAQACAGNNVVASVHSPAVS